MRLPLPVLGSTIGHLIETPEMDEEQRWQSKLLQLDERGSLEGSQTRDLTGKFWPKLTAPVATQIRAIGAFAGTSLMELAGLEPATSWVRSKALSA